MDIQLSCNICLFNKRKLFLKELSLNKSVSKSKGKQVSASTGFGRLSAFFILALLKNKLNR